MTILCNNCKKKSDKNFSGCCSAKCLKEYDYKQSNPDEIKLNIKDGYIFNPDELKLTIDDIKMWLRHRQETATSRLMKEVYRGLKHSLVLLPNDGVVKFWSDAIRDLNDLIIKNSLAHAKGNDESWAKTYRKIMESKEKEIKKIQDKKK